MGLTGLAAPSTWDRAPCSRFFSSSLTKQDVSQPRHMVVAVVAGYRKFGVEVSVIRLFEWTLMALGVLLDMR